jgi:protein LTV1
VFENILDDLLTNKRITGGRLEPRLDWEAVMNFLNETLPIEGLQNYLQEEEEEEDTFEKVKEAIPYIKRDESEQWDCESILTTYTNTENHPQMIRELPSQNYIHLNEKTGIPKIRLPRQERRCMLQKHVLDKNALLNLGIPRPEDEDTEKKRVRKRQIKNNRKVSIYPFQLINRILMIK